MDDEERYIPVEMSIVGSLLEIREMRAGRLPKPTPEDFFTQIDELIRQEESFEEDSQMEITRDYISVEQSIIDSLIEVKLMQAGKLPKPTPEDVFAEINELVEQENANADNTDEKVQ